MARRLLLLPPEMLPSEIPHDYPIDIQALTQAIRILYSGGDHIDVHESGTAMRFMAAYLAAYPTSARSIILQGAGRQHQRPIAPLIDALRDLGAEIEYLAQEGFPPLKITPKRLKAKAISLNASSSSQYLSALMLIAPLLEGEGYRIDTTEYPITSRPYATMTLYCMKDWGYKWEETRCGVFSYHGGERDNATNLLEADWTAASYAYLCMSLGEVSELYLPNLRLPSLQGDCLLLPKIFESLGVHTYSLDEGIKLHKCSPQDEPIIFDCCACPDLVPSIVSSCLGLGRTFRLTGVAHLRIKESDRLEALRQETSKLGIILKLEDDAISWSPQDLAPLSAEPIVLNTHGDHRMAMALAPLFAQKLGNIAIDTPEVVSKSFPRYWDVLRSLGYHSTP